MMALVVGSYYLLYLPASIEASFNYNPKVEYYVTSMCNFVFFMNALINPFIYSWQSKDFNMAYKKLLRINNNTVDAVTSISVTQNTNAWTVHEWNVSFQ